MSLSDTTSQPPRRPLLRRGLVGASLFAAGLFVGAAGLAVAHGGDEMGWHGGWHHHHHGPRVGMMQTFVRHALDNVGATTAQEDKVHDVIAGAYTELAKDEGDGRGAMRKQILDLMKAPTLDKAAFETLRAQKVADMDAKSKVISTALYDAASQLSPEQRAKLVQHVEERMAHKGWGWHRDHDGPEGKHDGEHGAPGDRGPGNHGPGDHAGEPDHG